MKTIFFTMLLMANTYASLDGLTNKLSTIEDKLDALRVREIVANVKTSLLEKRKEVITDKETNVSLAGFLESGLPVFEVRVTHHTRMTTENPEEVMNFERALVSLDKKLRDDLIGYVKENQHKIMDLKKAQMDFLVEYYNTLKAEGSSELINDYMVDFLNGLGIVFLGNFEIDMCVQTEYAAYVNNRTLTDGKVFQEVWRKEHLAHVTKTCSDLSYRVGKRVERITDIDRDINNMIKLITLEEMSSVKEEAYFGL